MYIIVNVLYFIDNFLFISKYKLTERKINTYEIGNKFFSLNPKF